MKPACFVCLLLFFATPVFGQSSPATAINQPTGHSYLGITSQPDPNAQPETLNRYHRLPSISPLIFGQSNPMQQHLPLREGRIPQNGKPTFSRNGYGAHSSVIPSQKPKVPP